MREGHSEIGAHSEAADERASGNAEAYGDNYTTYAVGV
jgi:hypothetical protein